MKNTIKVLGIIAFVAVIGFSMVSCGGGGGGDYDFNPDNLFVGIWSDGELTVKCTDTKWSASVPGAGSWKGSYSPNGDTASFIEDDGSNFGVATITSENSMYVNSTYGQFHLDRQ